MLRRKRKFHLIGLVEESGELLPEFLHVFTEFHDGYDLRNWVVELIPAEFKRHHYRLKRFLDSAILCELSSPLEHFRVPPARGKGQARLNIALS
jgi:hypothetical protein